MDDMRAAFVNQALTLSISTLPQLDPRLLCSLPPRRSDGEQGQTTDIFSQSQEDILDEVSGLTAESPDETLVEGSRLTPQRPGDHQEDKTCKGTGQKSTEQVTAFCRSLHDMNPLECPMSSSSSSSSSSLSPSPVSAFPPTTGTATQRLLSHADKLRKVINELVETEKTYVKDLSCLIECYLTPLQKESFLTQDELDVLFGNLGEMVEFQVEFLRTLEDGIRLVPDLDRLERVEQFKKVLFSLGGSFLYYADRFKIYSAFCASHTKVPKVLAKAKTDPDFKAFLAERNPRQQHSSTLESYLIKPIQRVLKYPLLLRELYSLTDPDSEEHYHLDVAMKAMNKVASHINEMQKLHEEYGAVFDQLINDQTADKKEVADLSMGDLLLHCTVVWINPPASLVKSKKDPDLDAFVFKTAVVFVYKDSSKHRRKIGGSHRASMSDDRDPFRFRHMIATDSLQLRALANPEGTAVCEIVHTRSESEGRPERTFQLCCRSPDSKKEFLKAVHSILREKQRRQLLKTESLPPNQQYVPFGGKRLCALKGMRPALNRAATAPSRNLARRKLVRNRFTIDTDLVFHGNNNNSNDSDPPHPPLSQHALPQSHKPQGEDTDRWVEEQFDLGRYEDHGEGIDMGQVKETDILSDDDEYCKSVRAASAEPADVEARMEGLDLQGGEGRSHNLNGRWESGSEIMLSVMQEEDVDRIKHGEDSDSFTSCGVSLSRCATPTLKLAPLKQCAAEGATNKDHDVIWVRRDDFANGCNSDVF
ncbi:rho guanine nucleotide exchange factor TIAM1 isoform X2 [Sebastes fasciatus]